MAMMTMVPVRVLHRVNYPRQFSIKAALPAKHPSDYLEFEQFPVPVKGPPSWHFSDALEFDQVWLSFELLAPTLPCQPALSAQLTAPPVPPQFAAGYPAKPPPSWNPSDRLEFDQVG